MAFYTFEQLTSPVTYAQARQTAIALLVSLGFKGAASWQEGSWPRTLGIEVPAAIIADLRGLAVAIASSGFNESASGSFLTVFSRSHYDNARAPAVKTQGTLVLTALPSALSNTFGPQELVASDNFGHTFRNLTGATLEPGAVLALGWEAEVAGSASNVAAGLITTLVTTLAGVSVSNPGSWITRVGAQAESDAKLRLRNSSKWGTRADTAPAAAYEHWALSANGAITRVYVDDDNPLGPGTVHIWIASDLVDAPVDLTDVAASVVALIEGQTDGRVRRGIGAIVSCAPAVAHNLPIDAIVYVATSWQDTAPAAIKAAIETLYATLPIGGIRTDGASGALPFASLYGAVMRVPGVVNVKFNTPDPMVTLGDRALLPSEIAVLSSYAMDIRYVT